MDTVIEKIKTAQSVAVLTHISEDADCLGSALAFCAVLRNMGKTAVCYVSEKPQDRLMFIGDDYVIYNGETAHNHDLCLCVDCADIGRLGERVKLFNEINNSVNIDHHKTNTMFADANYVEGGVSSTGEVLYRVFDRLGAALDDNIARLLYIAMCSDTGCFKYSSVTPVTFKIAAELISYDFDAAREARFLFDTETLNVTKFKAELMSRIESYAGGRIAAVEITDDMYEKYDIPPAEAPNGVDIPRKIEGVEIALCFKNKNGGVNVNFRSTTDTDVSVIAEKFGGGGHKAASGCTVKDAEMADVKKAVIAECEKVLTNA